MGLFDRFKGKSQAQAQAQNEGQPDGTPREASEQEAKPSEQEAEHSGGILAGFKRGLAKTSQLLNTDIRDLFKQEGQLLDDAFLDRLFAALIRTDMGGEPATRIRDHLARDFRGRVVHPADMIAEMSTLLAEMMAQEESPLQLAGQGPTVIMVVGVNGSGKTTSIAKLAHLLVSQGKRVVLGAGDTFRAAAVEQLTIWATRVGVDVVTGQPGCDPASVAHRAVARAIDTGADACIVDTAGRLQTQTNLMAELSKIRRVIGKQIPEAPHEVLLVLDATAGQNGISQAKGFSDAVPCSGIILAKLDGTAKGGVIIPIRRQFDLPVRYVGIGENAEDLALFNPDRFVEALFEDVET